MFSLFGSQLGQTDRLHREIEAARERLAAGDLAGSGEVAQRIYEESDRLDEQIAALMLLADVAEAAASFDRQELLLLDARALLDRVLPPSGMDPDAADRELRHTKLVVAYKRAFALAALARTEEAERELARAGPSAPLAPLSARALALVLARRARWAELEVLLAEDLADSALLGPRSRLLLRRLATLARRARADAYRTAGERDEPEMPEHRAWVDKVLG